MGERLSWGRCRDNILAYIETLYCVNSKYFHVSVPVTVLVIVCNPYNKD